MANRRVVVTGMGAVTPIGNDVKTYWEGLVSGKCGIDFVTRFDTADLKAKLGAEVKEFDPKQYMDAKMIRQTDLYERYALAAAVQAVQDAAIIGQIAPERLGVYFGSGIPLRMCRNRYTYRSYKTLYRIRAQPPDRDP